MKSSYTGFMRILKAFSYSFSGFVSAFKSEVAFKQDLVVFIIGTFFAVYLPFSFVEKSFLISTLLLILLMELTNTAIETIVDRISPEYHDLSKKAKDIGSLLVLLSFINAFLIWGTLIYQTFFR